MFIERVLRANQNLVLSLAQRIWDNPCELIEIECLLNDNHQKGKMMIMIMKTSGSQVDSPVAEGKRKEGGVMESGGSFICASCGGGFIQPITV